MRALAVLIPVLCIPLLSGCIDEAPTAPGEGVPTALPAQDLDWSLTRCRFAAFVIGVPAAAVQPYLPEGFAIQSAAQVAVGGQTGLPVPNPAADGNFGIEAFQCDEGTGLDGSVDGMTYASFFAGVEPPAALRTDAANHFVKWDVLVPDADRRALLATYGVPARNGTASVSATPMAGGATEFAGTFEAQEMGAFSFSGRAGLPLPECSFREFTPVPAGFVTWDMACTIVAGGGSVGTITVPSGSWAAQVVGAGTHQAAGFAGIVDFHTGAIHLPANA